MYTAPADVTALQTFVNAQLSAPSFDDVRKNVPAFANAKAGVIHQAMLDAGYKVAPAQITDNAADVASGAAVRAAEAAAKL